MKRYKYKREHFDTQEQYERFKRRNTEAKKRWIAKREENAPEIRERRILRQRLYSRYYTLCMERITFAEYICREYGIEDIRTIPLAELREIATLFPRGRERKITPR